MTDNHTRTEEFTINGEELLTRIKDLIRQGNIRRIIIKNKEGHILMELPLTIGVVSVVQNFLRGKVLLNKAEILNIKKIDN